MQVVYKTSTKTKIRIPIDFETNYGIKLLVTCSQKMWVLLVFTSAYYWNASSNGIMSVRDIFT